MSAKRMRVFAGPNGSAVILIAEITNGLNVNIFNTSKIPNWVAKYLLK